MGDQQVPVNGSGGGGGGAGGPETVNLYTPAAGVVTIDLDDGVFHQVNVNANITTFDYTNAPSGSERQVFHCRFITDASGPYTIAYAAAKFRNPNNISTGLTQVINAIDDFYYIWDGTHMTMSKQPDQIVTT